MALKLFIPCFLDQGAPRVAAAVTTLLDRLELPWEYPEAQTCCGQFAYTLGDEATARRLLRHFLRVFDPAEAVLCPSASCTFMVRRLRGPGSGFSGLQLPDALEGRGRGPEFGPEILPPGGNLE